MVKLICRLSGADQRPEVVTVTRRDDGKLAITVFENEDMMNGKRAATCLITAKQARYLAAFLDSRHD